MNRCRTPRNSPDSFSRTSFSANRFTVEAFIGPRQVCKKAWQAHILPVQGRNKVRLRNKSVRQVMKSPLEANKPAASSDRSVVSGDRTALSGRRTPPSGLRTAVSCYKTVTVMKTRRGGSSTRPAPAIRTDSLDPQTDAAFARIRYAARSATAGTRHAAPRH